MQPPIAIMYTYTHPLIHYLQARCGRTRLPKCHIICMPAMVHVGLLHVAMAHNHHLIPRKILGAIRSRWYDFRD